MYASETGSESCTSCAEGTYMNMSGATACIACDPGYTCAEGSVMQIPTMCEPGTYFDTVRDACVECPAGSWCAGGPPTSQPRLCSRGTYANETGSESCTSCAVGTYMDIEGATECIACDAGYTCAEGSVVQIPMTCSPGTYYNATQQACTDCPSDSWCPRHAGMIAIQ